MKILLAALLAIAAAVVHATNQPNVILIATDDQGDGDIASHGNLWLKAPEIDCLYNTEFG